MLIDRKKAIAYMVFLVAGLVVFISIKWFLRVRGVNLTALTEKRQLIAELSETIIPRTDTAGAKDAHVADFIIAMVTYGLSKPEQWTFLIGLEDVDRFCVSRLGQNFISCSAIQRTEVLRFFEESEWTSFRVAQKIRNKLFGRSFFNLLKWLTAIGYCSSEVGATEALIYDYLPDVYKGCIQLEAGQSAWAIK
ncbi:gluconate 2-dehydrogenase subunit 3 family protein [Parapedobacter deserti]|uniref:Gluconate 2-dehydrogenase subunit 3 family protein n=1 Tax=Parapedobacter deserti TaxID=1912957 RepID=A0ABV7JFY0_9SPHI